MNQTSSVVSSHLLPITKMILICNMYSDFRSLQGTRVFVFGILLCHNTNHNMYYDTLLYMIYNCRCTSQMVLIRWKLVGRMTRQQQNLGPTHGLRVVFKLVSRYVTRENFDNLGPI